MSNLNVKGIKHPSSTDTNISLGADGSVNVAALNEGPLAGMRNALINGILDHWQRGTSGFTGVGAYAADRWVLGGNNPAASRVTVTSTDANAGVPCTYGISISSSGGAYATIRQGIELIGGGGRPNQFQVGTQWTLSFYADTQTLADVSSGYSCGFADDANIQAGSPGGWTLGTYQKLEDVGTTWARYSVTYTVSNSPAGSNLCVSVPLSSKSDGSAVVYTGIQFEPGPVATPLEVRPVQTELALCQRYYRVSGVDNPPASTPRCLIGIKGVKASSSSARMTYDSTGMRTVASPTISVIGTISDLAVSVTDGTSALTSISGISARENTVFFVANFGSSAATNSSPALIVQAGGSVKLGIDAEL